MSASEVASPDTSAAWKREATALPANTSMVAKSNLLDPKLDRTLAGEGASASSTAEAAATGATGGETTTFADGAERLILLK